jgi:hypothetical protein
MIVCKRNETFTVTTFYIFFGRFIPLHGWTQTLDSGMMRQAFTTAPPTQNKLARFKNILRKNAFETFEF